VKYATLIIIMNFTGQAGLTRPPRLSESDPPALRCKALRAGGGHLIFLFSLYLPAGWQVLDILPARLAWRAGLSLAQSCVKEFVH